MLSALAADRARVADLDAEISVLQRALYALRVKRARVQDRLDAYKYPVLTLPSEIISEIFVHVIPHYPYCSTPTGRRSPTHLTQICRKWRARALQTPKLWRAILLPDPHIPLDKQASLSDGWLSRSGGCSISFHFHKKLIKGESEAEILPTIAPYRARLEYLVVNMVSAAQLRDIEGPMPLLRRLGLVFGDHNHFHTTPVSILEAPLLLDGAAVGNIILPWAQLTSLALYKVFPEDCAPILRQTPNLVHCELIFVGGDSPEDAPDVTVLSLQTLTLAHIEEDQSVTGFLQTIIVPSLRSLRVQDTFLGSKPIDTLKSFISTSGCGLQELCVVGPSSLVPTLPTTQHFPRRKFLSPAGPRPLRILRSHSDD